MREIGHSRMKEILKYSFYFTMTILAVVNITFFICYWNDWYPQFNDESILLSVVGFFFAFAGINIYSIFNTNIESEKQALRDLVKQYDGELKLSSKMLQFPQDLILAWHVSQYLTTANVIQVKAFDWMPELKSRLQKQRDFVQELKDNYRLTQFERYRDDLSNLAQGILSSLIQHREDLSNNNQFFEKIPANKENYLQKLDGLIDFVNKTVTYAYEPEAEAAKELSFMEKLKTIGNFARKVFRK